MRYPKISRSVSVLFLLMFLVSLSALLALSAPSPNPAPAAAPVRLRLKVENSTLRPGQGTRVSAQFLDRNYQPVPADAVRTIEFGVPTPSGGISPRQVTVRPGAHSADTYFTAGQPAKVVLTASSNGLDSAQIIVVVVRPAASLLSRLFETVAYAASYEGFELNADKLEIVANESERASFSVCFNDVLKEQTKIRIKVSPPAVLIYKGRDVGPLAEINFPANEAMLQDVAQIKSGRHGRVEVKAFVLPNGPEYTVPVDFIPPQAYQVAFGEETVEIGPHKRKATVSVRLEDKSHMKVIPDAPRTIRLSSESPVEFETNPITLSPQKPIAETTIRLKEFPNSGQLDLVAAYEGQDVTLLSGKKPIPVQSAVQSVVLNLNPSREVTQGKTPTELTVRLADKNGKLTYADWDRKIYLSASAGKLIPSQEVTIATGQDSAKVQYVPSGPSGKAVITANSPNLPDYSLEIAVRTALYWLVTFALLGGLIGGIVRILPTSDKVERVLPRWTADNWGLLTGRIAGSIVSGLFLYLTLKLGLSQALGSPALPAGFDVGTRLAAFFFGGIGGFAGTLVLDRLVSWLLPGARQQTPQTA